MRILIIDSFSDAAETLAELLSIFGHEVKLALTGPQGVSTAIEFRPHLVFSELSLPGLDGYAVCMSLRSNPETAAARLIALTTYGRPIDCRRAMIAGFNAHLLKPAGWEKLQPYLSSTVDTDGRISTE